MAKLTVGLLRGGERSLDAWTQLLLASLSLRVALLDALASLIAHPPLELVVPPLYGVLVSTIASVLAALSAARSLAAISILRTRLAFRAAS